MIKMKRFAQAAAALCLAGTLALAPFCQMNASAAEVIATVHGTVKSGTTGDMLLLDTPQGKMEIKIENATDTTAGKILLPGQALTVDVTGGSDGYLHAAKIVSGTQIGNVTVDTKNTATIVGKLTGDTKDNQLHFDTPQGEMVIILDSTTSMGSCAFLVLGNTYSVVCGRGSDAYMHAISISDSTGSSSSSSNNGDNSAYLSVSGKVEQVKEGRLYLSTNEGTMQFIIDNTANTLKGMMFLPDRRLRVSFYNGSDAYLHAVAVTGEKGSSSASVNSAAPLTATGTVNKKSTEDMLYLDTPQGQMEIKLDSVSSLNNCKFLTEDMKISVSCGSGSDAYLHALSITAV